MRLFRRQTETVVPVPAIAIRKPPVVEGWSERELAAVYNAAPVRSLKQRDALFSDVEVNESFFVILDGSLQVVVKWDGHNGRPGILRRGDCVAPLPKSPGLLYSSEAVEPCTVIEITPTVLQHLSDKTQLSIYKVAVASTSRINAYIRAVNGEVSSKNQLVASYIARQYDRHAADTESALVQEFLRELPRMPAYATDLAVKLLDESTSVQEIVEGIKADPAIASIVLRAVNSAQFSFQKKIETFYHACMILGLNNIYNMILREAVQSAMPDTADTRNIHRHSCLISVLCHEISSASRDVQAQSAATFGLLHDIGKGVRVLIKAKHPERAEIISHLPSARLGSQLLRQWGLPERLCTVIDQQALPEFTPPDMIAAEHRREVGVLHIAHILEALLAEEDVIPEMTIYTRDYMALLGLPETSPEGLLKNRILPNLIKNRHRLPEQIRPLIERHVPAE
jgi:HD-like signal output (HDOD) protein